MDHFSKMLILSKTPFEWLGVTAQFRRAIQELTRRIETPS